MKSRTDIILFDSNGTLTTEAIVRFKAKTLSDEQSKLVRNYIEHSSLGKEAVDTFNPDKRSELHQLNKRIEATLQAKINSPLENESNNTIKAAYVIGAIFLVGLIWLIIDKF